jgi:HSP20 family molecular chaperone IbpA
MLEIKWCHPGDAATNIMNKTALILATVGLTLGISPKILSEAINSPASKPAPATSTESNWSERWQKLESDLDKLFHDTVAKLHPAMEEKAFNSTVDVREKPDAFVARIYVPKEDESKVNVKFAQGALRITTSDKVVAGYDESIAIPGPVNAEKMKIEHKDGIVVVTLPKESKGLAAAPEAKPAPAPTTESWDQSIVREMQRMEDRMDQLTRDAFRGISGTSNTAANAERPLLGSSVSLDNDKDKYVVHFCLPDRDLSDVKVKVTDNDQLRITASEESKKETKTKTGTNSQLSEGEYSQVITLPGPVHAGDIKIDRKAGVVTVTLPKA